MNVDIVGKFYLGNGGIGDALLFLSTFYDDVESANVIFLANDPRAITEFFQLFPKINRKLILKNDARLLHELYYHQNCIGKGILPKNLDYSTWYKVDIFKEYGVKEFPKFVELFEPKKIAGKQIFIQNSGSQTEGIQKQRKFSEMTRLEIGNILSTYPEWEIVRSANTLAETFRLIRGSDMLIGVDSFAKTFSAMCGITTVVYDNIYQPEYLERFRDRIDYGHYVFIFPWSKIEFRKQ